LLVHCAAKRIESADAADRHAGAGRQPPGCRQPDPDTDERARPATDGQAPHLLPTTAGGDRPLHLGQQGSRVPRTSVGRQAERCLVQDFAAAQSADRGVGCGRVETDDSLLLGAQLSQ